MHAAPGACLLDGGRPGADDRAIARAAMVLTGCEAMADRLQLEIVDSRTIGEDHRLLLQPAR